MKMEDVQKELQDWGEIIIITDAGEQYELHLGDTEFDLANRMIKLTTPDAQYVIAGDAVENIKKHYGGRVSD